MATYLYRYSDGTTGNSPWKKDSSGKILEEGWFAGTVNQDGSVSQGLGNGAGMSILGGGAAALNNGQSAFSQKPQPVSGGGSSFGGGSSTQSSPSAGQSGGVTTPVPGGPMGQNPYLSQMGDVMAGQMADTFRTQVLPGISSSAMASGGFGGSRQGVVEANAMNDLGRNIGNSLTNLYGQGFNTALNYDLGMRNAANSYDLGLRNNQLGFGNLGLGYAGLDRQINNDNWANQMQGVNLGLGIWDRLMNNNQTGINAGTNIQNRPMDYWNQWSQGANSIGQGYGTQTSSGSNQGNPMLGALGGAQLGGQFSNWWNGGGNTSSMPNSNVFFGNGSMGD